ncbi:S9 family peptidase [Nocardioides sp. HDW12B]|uniref:prolyl oligopeptidase family serine peptidase n=1 Tax=Nocardioides sp. HDW12B TaxID=2714939 RepID=UPI00140C0EE7|nr:prolyl oligopeptidase family serine peptidase [Nocardioides sp. HDW12B]QIK67191.1 S9 family peptidase [Nocardioides sp. HDW12B]
MSSDATDPTDRTTATHGAWPSPFSARDTVTAGTVRTTPVVGGRSVWWLEARPTDAGRLTLVRGEAGEAVDVSAAGCNVRTAFHEYGGGAVAVGGPDGGLALYVDFSDQRVHRVDVVSGEQGVEVGQPRPVTPDTGGQVRWSCFRVDAARGVAFCLREDQRDPSVEPVTSLVRIDLDGPNEDLGVVLVAGKRRPVDRGPEAGAEEGPDFVLDPTLSPDGRRIAWLQWDHPNMAWIGTWLWVASVDEAGDLHDARVVAGGVSESVEQPRWLSDDRVVFLSDRSGWSNFSAVQLAPLDAAGTAPAASSEPVVLAPEERDFGQPRWTPDQSSYDLLPDGRIVTTRFTDGFCSVCLLDPATGEVTEVPTDVTGVFDLRAVGEHHATCRATFTDRPSDVVTIDLRDGTTRSVSGQPEAPDPAWVSTPEAVSWTSLTELGGDGATAHGFLYPPTNPDAAAPDGELPPLIVTLHGGPTAAAPAAYTRARTFWTSRGFAVLDVNYAGSTGYGRAYRERLDGQWGVAEVADVASGARHLADQGRVDPAKVAITGGSAGGYTTLAALTFTDAFAAGASHFGISDLAALARDTHKLESRYLDGLVAPWPSGEDVYTARSPIHHVDRLATPLILLQGTEDKVVPPDQAELMFEAVRVKGLPVALVMFDGEGHGFRDPANQARALESELSFYGQVFGFTPAGDVPVVEVENLP